MNKVCHITSVHSRYDGRIFKKECCSLRKAGYDVTLLVNDKFKEEEKFGIKIIPVQCPKKRIWRILMSSRAMYRAALNTEADVFHIHDPELLPLAKRIKNAGKKVIYDSHEFYFYQIKQKKYIPFIVRNIGAMLFRYYEESVAKCVDAVIVPCTINGKNYFEGKAKRTVYIDNLPIKDRYRSVSFEKKDFPCSCCYIGSISENRGINEILTSAVETNTRLYLAGSIDDNLRKKYKRLLDNKYIDYRGRIEEDEIRKIYDRSGIGLSILHDAGQYSLADNLPTKIYEYMASGIPVILSKNRVSKRFITKYRIGILVDANNIEDIKNAIEYLKKHKKEAEEMGKTGRQLIEDKFCWEKEAGKLQNLYEDIMI